MIRISTCVVLLVTALSAFAAASDPKSANQAVVDKFVWASVKPFYTTTVEQIRQFAQVESERKEPHPDGTASYTFHFKGLLVAGIDVPARGFMLQRLEATASTYLLADGLAVGSPISTVMARLGAPSKTTASALTFQGETEQVVFTVSNRAVSKVVFNVYTE